VCLARYVRGGLADIDAFLVYRALLDDGDTFVDVGANIGLHAVFAASLVGPHGRVVACEPDLGSGGWLERNLKLAGAPYHIETRPLADRRRCLGWIGAGETLSHLDLANGPRLETTTLDALFGECELDPTRAVVKLDVEGWEPTILLGGEGDDRRSAGALGRSIGPPAPLGRCLGGETE
jgi:FkbM family methyltransferase